MLRIIKPAVGSFTASNITVDSSGRIVAASSGAGAANMVRTFTENDDGTATFTAQPGTSKIHVYLRGGGGGGGGGNPGGTAGGSGGHGGFGFFNIPVSQPFSVPFTLGAGGSGGQVNPGPNAGTAGAASSFNTNLVANGGNGGNGGNQGPTGHGNNGTTQNSTFDYINGIPYADSNEILFTPEGMVKIGDTQGQSTTFNNSPTVQTVDPGSINMRIGGTGGAFGTGLQTQTRRPGRGGADGSVVVYEDIG